MINVLAGLCCPLLDNNDNTSHIVWCFLNVAQKSHSWTKNDCLTWTSCSSSLRIACIFSFDFFLIPLLKIFYTVNRTTSLWVQKTKQHRAYHSHMVTWSQDRRKTWGLTGFFKIKQIELQHAKYIRPLSIHCRLDMKITFHKHLTTTWRITAQHSVFFKGRVCENIWGESVQRPLVEYLLLYIP